MLLIQSTFEALDTFPSTFDPLNTVIQYTSTKEIAQAFELHLSSNDCEQLICDHSLLCRPHHPRVNAVYTASHIIRQLPFKISATQKIDYDRMIHFKPCGLDK